MKKYENFIKLRKEDQTNKQPKPNLSRYKSGEENQATNKSKISEPQSKKILIIYINTQEQQDRRVDSCLWK